MAGVLFSFFSFFFFFFLFLFYPPPKRFCPCHFFFFFFYPPPSWIFSTQIIVALKELENAEACALNSIRFMSGLFTSVPIFSLITVLSMAPANSFILGK